MFFGNTVMRPETTNTISTYCPIVTRWSRKIYAALVEDRNFEYLFTIKRVKLQVLVVFAGAFIFEGKVSEVRIKFHNKYKYFNTFFHGLETNRLQIW